MATKEKILEIANKLDEEKKKTLIEYIIALRENPKRAEEMENELLKLCKN